MKKPKIKISLIDQKGHMGCHRGHCVGDTFDFDTPNTVGFDEYLIGYR